MDGLVKLGLQGNVISTINCAEFKWFVCLADPALAYSETKIQDPIGDAEFEQESPNDHRRIGVIAIFDCVERRRVTGMTMSDVAGG